MKMMKAALYRALLALTPRTGDINAFWGMEQAAARAIADVLGSHCVVGGTLATFDTSGAAGGVAYGYARRAYKYTGVKAAADTVYRAASISKLATAMAALRLHSAGAIDMDADAARYLPCPLRHPAYPQCAITLRMLLTHTAGLRDGAAYINAQSADVPLSELLRGDCYAAYAPGAGFLYSNLGAGIAACVLEGMLGKPFERVMREALFEPLGVSATYYPQTVPGVLADGYRVLPPRKQPVLDGAARQNRPPPPDKPDPQRHYLLSQGNLCLTAGALAALGAALFSEEYSPMRREVAAFGKRDSRLSYGLGMFIYSDAARPRPVFGHQGMAYGAAHGLFFDMESGRGFALLTSGCSQAHSGVMADINIDFIRKLL